LPRRGMTQLVVIGASAGGVAALTSLAQALPADFAAPILIVLHIGAHASLLHELMARHSALDIAIARDAEVPQPGQVRIAPPDLHMTLANGRVRLRHGPKENHARPAIDPLFRSAALAFGPGVIGVVLTGRLDDGTAGLQAVKAMGGTAVVQDPADAEEPSMPASALRHVAVDHCVTLAQLPRLLADLTSRPVETPMTTPDPRVLLEDQLARGDGDPVAHLRALGRPSMFVCPECHGGLWQLDEVQPERYRCHTGHAFTERSLQQSLYDGADEALWNALRALQEKEAMLLHVAERLAEGDGDVHARAVEAAGRVAHQARALRQLILHGPPPLE